MELNVHEVCPAASGGSHVTIFESDLELTDSGVIVEILGIHPRDADFAAVELAKEAIRRGAEKVLQQKGKGAIIRVSRLVVHPVDFKSRTFERYTAEALSRLLEALRRPE